MKISELTTEYIANYLRLDEPEEVELQEIEAAHTAAIAYAKNYTGLTDEKLDEYEDITAAVLIIISDLFENRNAYLDYKYKESNRAVETILGMHQRNLL